MCLSLKPLLALLIIKPVANLPVNLPWIIPVKTAERQTVVQLNAAVCYIDRVRRNRKFFSERFTDGKIEGCVAGEVWAGILCLRRPVQPIGKARAIVHIG